MAGEILVTFCQLFSTDMGIKYFYKMKTAL